MLHKSRRPESASDVVLVEEVGEGGGEDGPGPGPAASPLPAASAHPFSTFKSKARLFTQTLRFSASHPIA